MPYTFKKYYFLFLNFLKNEIQGFDIRLNNKSIQIHINRVQNRMLSHSK